MFEFNVSSDPNLPAAHNEDDAPSLTIELLRQMLQGQQRQNELLENLIDQVGAVQRQRASEIGQWRDANPELAQRCRAAADVLGRVQTQYLENLTEEVSENSDHLMDGEFMLTEFIDRFGPRLAHLNGVLQILSQLSSVPNNTANSQ